MPVHVLMDLSHPSHVIGTWEKDESDLELAGDVPIRITTYICVKLLKDPVG